jgi:hypothetical protein
MKTLLAALGLLVAASVQAVPIHIFEFNQQNWQLTMAYGFRDSETGLGLSADEVLLNGDTIYQNVTGIGFVGFLPTSGLPYASAVFGENRFSIRDNGVLYQGPTFTLAQPVGDRPFVPSEHAVPESGNAAWLMLSALASLWFIRSHITAASV